MRSHEQGLTVPVAEVLDPDLWRQRYAYGLIAGIMPTETTLFARLAKAKIDASGEGTSEAAKVVKSLPDAFIRWQLRTALSELELKVGMPMGITIYKGDPVDDDLQRGVEYDALWPRQPYLLSQMDTWYTLTLPPSVISVERVRAYFFGTKVLEVPAANIQIQWPKQGGMNMLPLFSALNAANGGWYGGAVGLLLLRMTPPIPSVWSIDFTTGPITDNGQSGHIPAAAAAWVYAVAGQFILSIEGLARAKGVSSASVSMDGVSRSISLGGNGPGGINAAAVGALKEIESRIDWKLLRTSMRGIRVVAY